MGPVLGDGRPPAVAEPAAPVAELSALQLLLSRGRLRGVLALLGPAFVAAVAYIDPGNFATNFTAGARFGYTLAWVIVVANLMAMLVQYLSAKAGVATGRDLPELCREHLPRPVSRGLWVQAEVIAMATDLAEFVGAAVGLNLLFHVPLFPAGLITAVVAFGILALEQRGYRRFELAIVGLLCIVFLGFLYDLAVVGADPVGVAGGMVPGLAGNDSLLVVAGIIGATVMPHVVYLHSALTKARVACRDDAERHELLRFQRLDVVIGLGAAGVINLSMLVIAASMFNRTGHADVDSIEAAHAGLGQLVGGGAALAFAAALLASGLSSSSVGTYAGQVVMQGFIRRRIPLFVRRGLTMLPALLVLGLGLPATDSLVISQVVLSFGIPFALVPLLLLTRRADIMGSFVNNRVTTAIAGGIAAVIIVLNVYLLYVTFLG
ncbi:MULTISPECIES: Nramp family divalent metal transporter [Micromonospora]|uniref:Divalent metal cation transporter MntH n=1 Tax=Micromonospora sicca TaxID=2202420 RepID=A0A317CZF8_9ACTN|nr:MULTISPECIES: Nramp family divalent metal transporter [unclassified Micromonospora]MBM0225468.1 Nramp family divalent metal transporter [Micromonospora sp. ATA51]PWR08008.1 divalent metal cation transporter [Micromonospora sp. 4G51]